MIRGRIVDAHGRAVFFRNAAGGDYSAAGTGRRSLSWLPSGAGPNDSTLGNLTSLRNRSRAAVRNDGYAGAAIDVLVSNIIGTGIVPRSQATDEPFRKAVQAAWLRWTDESDADGRLDFYGQQALAARTWMESGEAFIRVRPRLASDGLSIPLQFQVIEPDQCPVTHNGTHRGHLIRGGIEYTPIGRKAAYWMHQSRPGDPQDFDTSKLVRVPADQVFHLYLPMRPGQLRGIPRLTRALVKLRDRDIFDDATLLRQQLANLFVGFVKKADVPSTTEVTDPLTNEAVTRDTDGKPMIALEPGIWQELGAGEEIEFSNPPDVGAVYADYMRLQLRAIAVAVGVPYELLTGDMSQLNDRTLRAVLTEFRRAIEQLQHHIVVYQLCRPAWLTWFDRAVIAGKLPVPTSYFDDPEPFTRAKFVPQGWAYIHPVQDVQAKRDAIRAGLSSRTAEVAALGEDVEELDAEIAADNARADRLGLVFDSDGRKTSRTGSTVTGDPAPAPGGDPSERSGDDDDEDRNRPASPRRMPARA